MTVRVTTVVSAEAETYDLVTLSVVKDELEVDGGGDDTKLGRYIAAASVAISNYCNRVFAKETVVDTFDISRARFQHFGQNSLQLSRWPVVSIASITESGVALVQGTDYRVDLGSGLLYRLDANGLDSSWRSSPVIVTYDGGYAAIPADLQDAAVRMVRGRWFAKDRDPLVRQENIPGVRDVSFWVPTGADAGNIPPDVMDIIDDYRVPIAI